MKRMWEIVAKWQAAATEEEYTRLAKEAFDLYAENLWVIGTVVSPPLPNIVKNNLRNFPSGELVMGSDFEWFAPYLKAQWFFKK